MLRAATVVLALSVATVANGDAGAAQTFANGDAGAAQTVEFASPPREYQIKAAFLYNFARFVTWPAQSFAEDDAFVLAIIGEDPFGAALTAFEGRQIAGRNVVIKRFSNIQDLESCHLLFIGSSETKELEEILASVDGSRVLTVGEMADFVESGGMINFIIRNNKVRFQINASAAQRAGLDIDLQLLRLAHSGDRRAS